MKYATLWMDEGLPALRVGRGKLIARGSSLEEGFLRENRKYQRGIAARFFKVSENEIKILIGGN